MADQPTATGPLFWAAGAAALLLANPTMTRRMLTGLDAGYDPNERAMRRSGAWWCGRCGVGAMLGEKMHRCADLNRSDGTVTPGRYEYHHTIDVPPETPTRRKPVRPGRPGAVAGAVLPDDRLQRAGPRDRHRRGDQGAR